MLAGIFYGAMYGGSTTSILLNIPGEAASVVTCLDGYQMARRGRAGAALGVAAFGSFVAGTLGLVAVMLLAPPLATFALRFGPPEYFALLVLGLVMVGYLSGGSMTKGLMMAALGLLLGTVGLDPIMGGPRFTYGIFQLGDGLPFILAAMGLFGIGEVLVERGAVRPVRGRGGADRAPPARPGRVAPGRSGGPARLPPGLPGRRAAGRRRGHLLVPVVLRREAMEPRAGALRPGRDRGRGGARVGQQRRRHRLVHPAAHAGRPGERLDRDDLRRAPDPRRAARGRSWSPSTRTSSGGSSPPCTSGTSCSSG